MISSQFIKNLKTNFVKFNYVLLNYRELRCNEGKQVGLENGICEGKGQSEKNQVDFMVSVMNI